MNSQGWLELPKFRPGHIDLPLHWEDDPEPNDQGEVTNFRLDLRLVVVDCSVHSLTNDSLSTSSASTPDTSISDTRDESLKLPFADVILSSWVLIFSIWAWKSSMNWAKAGYRMNNWTKRGITNLITKVHSHSQRFRLHDTYTLFHCFVPQILSFLAPLSLGRFEWRRWHQEIFSVFGMSEFQIRWPNLFAVPKKKIYLYQFDHHIVLLIMMTWGEGKQHVLPLIVYMNLNLSR